MKGQRLRGQEHHVIDFLCQKPDLVIFEFVDKNKEI